jgi:fructose-1,6-bisphosphatase I
MIYKQVLTLDEFTAREMKQFPKADREMAGILRDIGLAAKRVNAAVNKAGLAGILGNTGKKNIQGEEIKKLDQFANAQFANVLKNGINCAGIASEEMDECLAFDNKRNMHSNYVCMFDPLDGSSNIDVNVSIGTIFSVYLRVTKAGSAPTIKDFLQPGTRQVAAGYIIYGPSAILVYANCRGVNGFTLDTSIGEFCLSHPCITCPRNGQIYSVNHGNFFRYTEAVRNYITTCQHKNECTGGPYSQRYVGSMVSDIHRNLLKGGIFMYPATIDNPNGKLRLLYECNPMAYIIEKAGGRATDGTQRILEKTPLSLHERSPLFIGSKEMIEELESCYREAEEETGKYANPLFRSF